MSLSWRTLSAISSSAFESDCTGNKSLYRFALRYNVSTLYGAPTYLGSLLGLYNGLLSTSYTSGCCILAGKT